MLTTVKKNSRDWFDTFGVDQEDMKVDDLGAIDPPDDKEGNGRKGKGHDSRASGSAENHKKDRYSPIDDVVLETPGRNSAQRHKSKRSVPQKVNLLPQHKRVAVPHAAHKEEPVALGSEQELGGFLNDIHKILATMNTMKQNYKIIGVTSALPQEGSSTLVSLIATLDAGMQSKISHLPALTSEVKHRRDHSNNILLIDTQLHNPSLHKNFGIQNSPGLFDLLNGKVTFDYASQQVSSHLQLIPVGMKPRASFTRMEIKRLSDLLIYARSNYDTVYLDIPSLLRFPEGILLSRLCDAVILVIEARQTRVEVIQDTRRLLERSGVKIMGGILNKRKFYIPNWLYNKL